jgi:hypothetical protein
VLGEGLTPNENCLPVVETLLILLIGSDFEGSGGEGSRAFHQMTSGPKEMSTPRMPYGIGIPVHSIQIRHGLPDTQINALCGCSRSFCLLLRHECLLVRNALMAHDERRNARGLRTRQLNNWK